MNERDFDIQPYTPDEMRVCKFLQEIAPDLGCGNDPIGFFLACYATLIAERATRRNMLAALKTARRHAELIRLAPERRYVISELDAAIAKAEGPLLSSPIGEPR